MRASSLLATGLVLCLSACQHTVTRLTVNEHTLSQRAPAALAQCPLRLDEVLDQRPGGDSGGLNWNQIVVEDAPKLVREQLLAAGMLPADSTQGRGVSVRLKQMYLSQNIDTKNPVVVYEAVIAGGAPFLVRAQPTIGNWAGSQAEAMSAFSRALREANAKLIGALNQRCPAAGAG